MLEIERIDHVVFTVRDVAQTCAFYTRVLGFEEVSFGAGRKALRFGDQKLNLYAAEGHAPDLPPRPTVGSHDLCFVTRLPIEEVVRRLQAVGVEGIRGPNDRTGARGPLRSVYFPDPDGNAIEVAQEVGTG